jgi:hypothetical protein
MCPCNWGNVFLFLVFGFGVGFRQTFDNLEQLSSVSATEGYSGGMRVLQATVHRFYRHMKTAGVVLPTRNFALTYHTNVSLRRWWK